MDQHPLETWAQMAVAPEIELSLHPTFIGLRGRTDAWHNQAWLPQQDHHVLFLVDEGYCDLTFEDARTVHIGPGDCFLLHPKTGPAVQFSQTIKFYETYIMQSRKGCSQFINQEFLQIKQAWGLGAAINALALYRQQDPSSNLLRFSVAQLLLRFAALLKEQQGGEHGLSSEQCNVVIQWTRAHIHLCPEPRDIAQLLNLTPDYCSRVFRQRFQMSLRDWLIRERIQEAARRLTESKDSIESVGIGLGFTDPAHFSRQFKKHMHCTPSAWRKR